MSGELGVQIPMMTIKFLSHACGGEQLNLTIIDKPQFLSHACGGEHCLLCYGIACVFLSHACGGEQGL